MGGGGARRTRAQARQIDRAHVLRLHGRLCTTARRSAGAALAEPRHSRSRPPSDASTGDRCVPHAQRVRRRRRRRTTGARRLPPLAVVVALGGMLALTALLTDPADDARESAFIGTLPSSARLVVVAAALARIVGGAEHTLPAALLATRGGSRGGLLAVTTP